MGKNLMKGAMLHARKRETVEERGVRMMKEALHTIRSVGGSRVDKKARKGKDAVLPDRSKKGNGDAMETQP